MSTLFLIFNHRLTVSQEENARMSLEVKNIINLSDELQELWSSIPPDLPAIRDYLKPIEMWLSSKAKAGDYVLIQGDFGACYLMVTFALEHNLIPVYSTTQREVVEEEQPNGAVKVIHHFQHELFRRYGR
ncbi:MAG TPA: hypothetical protein DCY12_08930 [Candidatus Atribacteria bacterium]|nr:hypothetical protein [Candidatus Atribacteria bacterium]